MNDIQRLYVMARSLTMTARVSDNTHKELCAASDILRNVMTREEMLGALYRIHDYDVYSAPLSAAYDVKE